MTYAVRIHEPGGPEVMKWEPVTVGAPGPKQVLLRHTAVGLNFIDVYYRSGLYPAPLPLVLGREAAGIVEAIGAEVTSLQVGDHVAYAGVLGSYAQARVIDADQLAKLPAGLDDRTAASITLQGMTAHFLLHDVYKVRAGETILVHAAAGGVGLLLCQWASKLGVTVIGTVSSDEKAALAKSAGCHYPVVYTRDDFAAKVLEVTGGKKVPVIYDAVGKDTFAKSIDCLRPRGLMVVYGQASGVIPPIDINLLGHKGSLSLTRPRLPDFIATPADLQSRAGDVYRAILSGVIKPSINQVYPLQEAAQAHRDLEARKTTGSTIFTI
jgi:NADPH2:quinone reductase